MIKLRESGSSTCRTRKGKKTKNDMKTFYSSYLELFTWSDTNIAMFVPALL